MKLVFDIETNGLIDATKIWCIVAKDIETNLTSSSDQTLALVDLFEYASYNVKENFGSDEFRSSDNFNNALASHLFNNNGVVLNHE